MPPIDMSEYVRKSQPTPSDVHVSGPLTNISVAYVQDEETFIADKVFPSVPVQKQFDQYYVFDKNDFLRNEARKRAPSSESAGGGFGLTTLPYNCDVVAFHKDIDDRVRANADTVLSIDAAVAKFVAQKLWIEKEASWIASYFTTGIWGTDVTGVAAAPGGGQFLQWDQTTSRPRKDIEVGKMAIKRATGFRPNTMVLQEEVFSALTDNAAIRDQFKYTSADSIDEAMMARYFGVQRLFVLGAVSSTGNEGGAQTTNFMAGKHVGLFYTTNAPSLMTPTAGYTFSWNGYTGAVAGMRTSKLRMEPIKSDRIEGENAYIQKVVAASMGYFLSGAVA